MPQNTIHVGARIPKELYNKCKTKADNITIAIIDGLNLLCETDCKTQENNCKTITEEFKTQLEERDERIQELVKELEDKKESDLQLHEVRIKDLQEQIEIKDNLQEARIKELQDQLKVKDDHIKANDVHQHNRIEDLKNTIYLLDNQMRTKDDQIEKLNENMHKQAVHIQSLIQENSRLNTKLLPENVENKKPWWRRFF